MHACEECDPKLRFKHYPSNHYHNNEHCKAIYSCHLGQLDGNLSELETSSVTCSSINSLLSSPSCQTHSLEESLSGRNLSMFLPYSNHNITYEDISINSSFFSQTSNVSDIKDPSLPPNDCKVRQQPQSMKMITAQSLPNIMVANHRSIFPKFSSLINELLECEIHVGIHSEIWEDNEKIEHKNKVEEALELHGIVYISNPRPKRRGGGAAITLCDPKSKFSLSKLPIHIPPDLEVCWGLVKPKQPGTIKNIIICSFYSPP